MRLASLERAAAGRVPPHHTQEEDGEDPLQAAWEIMRPSMSDEHALLVIEAYAAWLGGGRAWDDSPGGRLLRRCLDAMYQWPTTHWPYSEIATEVALAMPPEVAQAYMRDPGALPLHDCGYKVPHQHFKVCPLCEGQVGWYAYWKRSTGTRA